MATYIRAKRKNTVVQDQLKAEKYIIISGTNRAESNSIKIAKYYQEALQQKQVDAELITLEKLDLSERSAQYMEMETTLFIPAAKFIFICPEYNGSIPGVLKTLLDISDYKKVWWNKKALLTGISTGRSGNVRGLEHLTTILHYLKVNVHPNKLPISSVDKLLTHPRTLADPDTIAAIDIQLDEFIKF